MEEKKFICVCGFEIKGVPAAGKGTPDGPEYICKDCHEMGSIKSSDTLGDILKDIQK